MKRWLAAFAVLLGLAGEARGDDGGQVIVLVTRKGGVLTARVRAELESMGFRVVVRGTMRRELPQGTVAIARIIDDPPSRIEVEAANHLAPPQEAVIALDGAGSGVDVGSVQAAERVRAYFQPLAPPRPEPPTPTASPTASPAAPPLDAIAGPAQEQPSEAASHPGPATSPQLAAQPPNPPAPPAARTSASAPPRRERDTHPDNAPRAQRASVVQPDAGAEGAARRSAAPNVKLGLSLGLGLPIDAGGVGVDAVGAFWLSPIRGLRFGPIVSVPLVPTSLSGAGGTADLYAGKLGILASGTVVSGSRIDLAVGGGVAGSWLRTVGHANLGYVGRRSDVLTASCLADIAVRAHVHGSISIGPRAMIGVAVPTPEIQFAGHPVARWGLPWGQLAATVEIHR